MYREKKERSRIKVRIIERLSVELYEKINLKKLCIFILI